MSRAEDLAKEIETRYRRGYETQEQASHRWLSSCKEAAAELRRLAQVEEEHTALKKAISDAEPVAWLVCSVNKDKSLSLEHAAPWKEAAHEHINDAINEYGLEEAASWIVREVYTLEGIRTKP